MHIRLRNPDRTVQLEGHRTVGELLRELEIAPHTVLVIVDGELATSSAMVDEDARVEVRPVMSGGADDRPRCVVCRDNAIIDEPRHRAAWCGPHFIDHVQRQVRKAIDQSPGGDGQRMFSYADRILLAVSGGKDSLALWDILHRLGYDVDGLYIGLGIGGYSQRSLERTEAFASARGLRLRIIDLADDYGYSTPGGAQASGRAPCGVCGLSKRYVFNRVAVDHGYDVVATGHNLDDEAATLLGNLVRWQEQFLARQRPVLPTTGANQVRKVKPLYRLSEREIAAYCVVQGIDYIVEECPLVEGNTGVEYKQALDVLEAATPGVKAQFLFGFLDRRDRWFAESGDEAPDIGACATCGMPAVGETCAFCRQRDRIGVTLPLTRGAQERPVTSAAGGSR